MKTLTMVIMFISIQASSNAYLGNNSEKSMKKFFTDYNCIFVYGSKNHKNEYMNTAICVADFKGNCTLLRFNVATGNGEPFFGRKGHWNSEYKCSDKRAFEQLFSLENVSPTMYSPYSEMSRNMSMGYHPSVIVDDIKATKKFNSYLKKHFK